MTKYTYSIPNDPVTGEPSTTSITRSDGCTIPVDEGNLDYQRYLNPEAEQSTPTVEVTQ
jgi:hypothetical protein